MSLHTRLAALEALLSEQAADSAAVDARVWVQRAYADPVAWALVCRLTDLHPAGATLATAGPEALALAHELAARLRDPPTPAPTPFPERNDPDAV